MIKNLEIEYKISLTETTFKRILNALPFAEPYHQINTYYDTEDLKLYQNKWMCRIRATGTYFLFTLKIPQKHGVLEHELRLDEPNLNHPEIQAFLTSLKIATSELKPITQSDTLRSEYRDEYGTWCLDETHFNQEMQDFELEYELSHDNEAVHQHYHDTLKRLNIPNVLSQPKFIRALQASGRKLPKQS